MRAWEEFLTQQESELGKETVDRWLRTLAVLRFDACNLYLKANDSFQALWFEEHVRKKAQVSFRNNNHKLIKIHLQVESEKSTSNARRPKKKKKVEVEPVAETPKFNLQFTELDPYCTFDNFVPSEENSLAFKLLCEIGGYNPNQHEIGPSSTELGTFNPIYLHGPSGCGKSHLLMSTANCLRQRGLNVIYALGDTFTEHVVTAIRAGEMQTFRKAYRSCDVLLIDDIQIFSRKGATQEEFFHTFNTLHVEGRQIILTANCNPQELQLIEPRLVSRFEWGIVLPLEALGKKKQAEMFSNKCALMNFPLNERVREFLLNTFCSNPKALNRALEALILRCHLKQGKPGFRSNTLTVELVESLLEDLLKEEKDSAITPNKIIESTAEFYGIRSEDILSKSQNRECVVPRQVAMYLCRSQLKIPYIKLGDIFSRDHSTVMASVNLIKKRLIETDREIIGSINSVLKKVQQ